MSSPSCWRFNISDEIEIQKYVGESGHLGFVQSDGIKSDPREHSVRFSHSLYLLYCISVPGTPMPAHTVSVSK